MTNIFGLIGGSLGIISFIPQIIKSYRSKQTRDLSARMFSLLVVGNILWIIHGTIHQDFALILTNSIAMGMTLSVLIMKLRFG